MATMTLYCNQTLAEIYHSSEYLKANASLNDIAKAMLKINRYAYRANGPASITRAVFKIIFGPQYAKIIRELQRIDLVNVKRVSVEQTSEQKGKCFSYSLTALGANALHKHSWKALCELKNNPAERRKNQKRISKRGYSKQVFNDIRDYHKSFIDGMEIDLTAIEAAKAIYTDGKATCVTDLLSLVERKAFALEFSEKNNRIWTPYAGLPAEIRKLITVNGSRHLGIRDIRCCHPSLFALHIQRLFPFDARSESAMAAEVSKWNKIFNTPDLDPKTMLASELKIERAEVKAVMIQYFNGKGFTKKNRFTGYKCPNGFKQFNAWISREFPCLYALWLTTEIKQTGNQISKHFETKLMLDSSIYEMATSLGLILGYEYDGFSIYGNTPSTIGELENFIQRRSIELLGIQLVFTNK